MKSFPFKISGTKDKTFRIEMNASRFERIAAGFGFFNPEFLKSIKRAETDVRAGRVRIIKSFADLKQH